MPPRDQRVAFGVVAGATTLWDIVLNHPQITDLSEHLIICVRRSGDIVAISEFERCMSLMFINSTFRVP